MHALLLVNMSCVPTVGRASDRFAFANSSSGSKFNLALLTTSLPFGCSSVRLKENWSYFKTIGLQDGELYFKICKVLFCNFLQMRRNFCTMLIMSLLQITIIVSMQPSGSISPGIPVDGIVIHQTVSCLTST